MENFEYTYFNNVLVYLLILLIVVICLIVNFKKGIFNARCDSNICCDVTDSHNLKTVVILVVQILTNIIWFALFILFSIFYCFQFLYLYSILIIILHVVPSFMCYILIYFSIKTIKDQGTLLISMKLYSLLHDSTYKSEEDLQRGSKKQVKNTKKVESVCNITPILQDRIWLKNFLSRYRKMEFKFSCKENLYKIVRTIVLCYNTGFKNNHGEETTLQLENIQANEDFDNENDSRTKTYDTELSDQHFRSNIEENGASTYEILDYENYVIASEDGVENTLENNEVNVENIDEIQVLNNITNDIVEYQEENNFTLENIQTNVEDEGDNRTEMHDTELSENIITENVASTSETLDDENYATASDRVNEVENNQDEIDYPPNFNNEFQPFNNTDNENGEHDENIELNEDNILTGVDQQGIELSESSLQRTIVDNNASTSESSENYRGENYAAENGIENVVENNQGDIDSLSIDNTINNEVNVENIDEIQPLNNIDNITKNVEFSQEEHNFTLENIEANEEHGADVNRIEMHDTEMLENIITENDASTSYDENYAAASYSENEVENNQDEIVSPPILNNERGDEEIIDEIQLLNNTEEENNIEENAGYIVNPISIRRNHEIDFFIRNTDTSLFNQELYRILSFLSIDNNPIYIELSRNGFYYEISTQTIVCIFCNLRLTEDELNSHDVSELHTRSNPSCLQNNNPANVPLSNINNYRFESHRLYSFMFVDWSYPVRVDDLAKNGFHYTGVEDVCRCTFCRLEVRQWEQGDTAFAEHTRWNERCAFLQGRSVGNVPLGEDTAEELVVPRPRLSGGAVANEPPTYLEPRHPEYATLEDRLNSFVTWPTSISQTPLQVSMAGFYYTGRGDRVVCFHCGGGLRDWGPQDDPWVEHATYFSRCNFLLENKGAEFIARVQEARIEMEGRNNANEGQVLQQPLNVLPPVIMENVENPEINAAHVVADNNVEAAVAEASPWICVICRVNQLQILFLPCGHVASCIACATRVDKCPMCSSRTTAYVRTYLP